MMADRGQRLEVHGRSRPGPLAAWRGRSALPGYGQRGTGALQLVFDRLDT
jgi:hypothetical protein